MCSMPWRQVSILNENKEKTPQLQYECDVFSCHGRGNPAPSNFRLDAHAHKPRRILLYEFAVPFRPLVAGGIVRHENNVAVLVHLFYLRPFRSPPASLPVLAELLLASRMDYLFSRERSHCGQTFSQQRRNGTRTRGLNLGKVALYQLSYVRKLFPPWWATSRKYT